MTETETKINEKNGLCANEVREEDGRYPLYEDLKNAFLIMGVSPAGVAVLNLERAVTLEDAACVLSEKLHMMGWRKVLK